ncbi:hypothetical protein OIU76_001444 [Salix suchowensis]|nr:hypothetical protein OIU76_001444 [Salix suchowensis]
MRSNLENNNLSGKIPVNFTAKKLKLKGNSGLCVDGGDLSGYAKFESSLGKLKLCNKSDISSPVLLQEGPLDSSSSSSSQTQAFILDDAWIWIYCLFYPVNMIQIGIAETRIDRNLGVDRAKSSLYKIGDSVTAKVRSK